MGLGIAVPDAELYAEARNLARSNQNTTLMAAGTLLVLFCIIFLTCYMKIRDESKSLTSPYCLFFCFIFFRYFAEQRILETRLQLSLVD